MNWNYLVTKMFSSKFFEQNLFIKQCLQPASVYGIISTWKNCYICLICWFADVNCWLSQTVNYGMYATDWSLNLHKNLKCQIYLLREESFTWKRHGQQTVNFIWRTFYIAWYLKPLRVSSRGVLFTRKIWLAMTVYFKSKYLFCQGNESLNLAIRH